MIGTGGFTTTEGRDVFVLINTDDPHIFLRGSVGNRTGTGRTTGTEDDICAITDELFGGCCTTIGGSEAVDVDTQDVDVRVDVTCTLFVTVAELDDRRDVDAIDTGNRAALRRQSCQCTDKEACLIFAELD